MREYTLRITETAYQEIIKYKNSFEEGKSLSIEKYLANIIEVVFGAIDLQLCEKQGA